QTHQYKNLNIPTKRVVSLSPQNPLDTIKEHSVSQLTLFIYHSELSSDKQSKSLIKHGAMASTLSISSTIVDAKAPRHSIASSSSSSSSSQQCVSLPTLPLPPTVRSSFKPANYCRKIARNVMAMATGEAQASSAEVVTTTEMPEIVKTVQDAWDKVEDKYAVSSLGVAAALAIWSSSGMIAFDFVCRQLIGFHWCLVFLRLLALVTLGGLHTRTSSTNLTGKL
ncbi:Protein CURVATURE THYLAKOID 1B, chloroplastic, partial [Linum perenne]